MHPARRRLLLLSLLTAALAAGCGRKEVTSLQRKEAASLVSEADFAITLRDYPRAESVLAEAVKVCPDTADYWLTLGSVRRRLDHRSEAKAALEQALELYRDQYRRDGNDSRSLLQQVYLLALLGRTDDARALLDQAQKDHPDDRNIRGFAEGRQLDHLLESPAFKELAL